ncbi:hypothetical protein QTA57_06630 [Fontisubflavum oceani]|uniref:hypothetical protein n=1 Tax=Fontisubflavum oceani TaxID=2978973 RepID=UPI0025B5C0CB|nr:hypothetical protein [Fontisubflavum oceani]WJY22764.1 hypothetical protein QTA57_06630 [Fontisubflavum oceani]
MDQVDDRYERRLLDELKKVDQKIARLSNERDALIRLLSRARVERHADGDRTILRSTSIDRIAVETKILQFLGDRAEPAAARDIYEAAIAVFPGLKESTFRSHMHRLKQKGKIEPVAKARGRWKLSPST